MITSLYVAFRSQIYTEKRHALGHSVGEHNKFTITRNTNHVKHRIVRTLLVMKN